MSDELSLFFAIPPELVDQLVELVAAKLEERMRVAEPAGVRWMTVRQAAEHLAMTEEALYKRVRSMPHSKIGGRILFDVEALDRWVRENYEGPRVSRPPRARLRVAP